ncbi:hypothetical protein ACFLZM_01400 [Thermodesulfobacteriota bacterium]
MSISHQLLKIAAADLYERSLKIVPAAKIEAVKKALSTGSNPIAQDTLKLMLKSAVAARENNCIVWEKVGLVRDKKGLTKAADTLAIW